MHSSCITNHLSHRNTQISWASRARIPISGMCALFAQDAKHNVCSASMPNACGASNDSAEAPHRAAKVETTSLRRSVSSRARCARFSAVLQVRPRHCNFAQPVPTFDAAAAPSTIVSTYVQLSKRQSGMSHLKASLAMNGKSNFRPLWAANRMRGVGERNLKICASNCGWLLSLSEVSTALSAKLSRKVAKRRNASLKVGDGANSSTPMPWTVVSLLSGICAGLTVVANRAPQRCATAPNSTISSSSGLRPVVSRSTWTSRTSRVDSSTGAVASNSRCKRHFAHPRARGSATSCPFRSLIFEEASMEHLPPWAATPSQRRGNRTYGMATWQRARTHIIRL